MHSFTCETYKRTITVPRIPWSVKCCALNCGLKISPKKVVENRRTVKPKLIDKICVHRGQLFGEMKCGCSGTPEVFECNKLGSMCWTRGISKPGGWLADQYVSASDIVSCSTCEHFEQKATDGMVQWVEAGVDVSPVNRNAIVTVAVGDEFSEVLELTRPFMELYARRIGWDFVCMEDKTQAWAPLEKFRCKSLFDVYDKIIFIDADVVIHPEAMLLNVDGVGMHDDFDELRSKDWIAPEWRELANSQGVGSAWVGRCYNSGVIACDAASKCLFDPPARPFIPTHCAEQLWIEHNAIKNNLDVVSLQWRWNAQWWMDDFDSRKLSSHFIHFANCTYRPAEIREFIETINSK